MLELSRYSHCPKHCILGVYRHGRMQWDLKLMENGDRVQRLSHRKAKICGR